MRKPISIGGEQVEIYANAATPLFYKHVFQDDLLRHIGSDEDSLVRTDTCMKLTFILVMQARNLSTGDMIKLRESDCIAWLAHYEYTDMLDPANKALYCFLGIDEEQAQGGDGEESSKNAPEEQSAS